VTPAVGQETVVEAGLWGWSLPMTATLRFGAHTMSHREGWLVWVRTSQGRTGWGEAAPLPAFGTGTLAQSLAALHTLLPALQGLAVPTSWRGLVSWAASIPAQRVEPCARGAVVNAMATLAAGARPLHQMLLPASTGVASVNAMVGAGVDDLATWGRQRLDEGFRVLKCKVGAGPWEEEQRRLQELRHALRRRTWLLRLDANGAWSREEAAHALESLRGWPVDCVEQPVAADDHEGLMSLARRSPVPVAADEALHLGPAAWDRLVRRGGVQVAVLKPALLGGVDVAWEAVRRVQRAGLRVVVTTALDGALGRRLAMHVAAAADPACNTAHGLGTGTLLQHDLTPARDPLARGRILLPATAGLGLAIDPADAPWARPADGTWQGEGAP
jgi:o-succinylbenzoate synthase